jgi:hypothetical protein
MYLELFDLVCIASLLLSCVFRFAKYCLLLMLIILSQLCLDCSGVGSEVRVPNLNVCPRQPSLLDLSILLVSLDIVCLK